MVSSQLSACPGEIEPFKDHSTATWALVPTQQGSETNHSKSNLYHQYLPEFKQCVQLSCDGEKYAVCVCVCVCVYVRVRGIQCGKNLSTRKYIFLGDSVQLDRIKYLAG